MTPLWPKKKTTCVFQESSHRTEDMGAEQSTAAAPGEAPATEESVPEPTDATATASATAAVKLPAMGAISEDEVPEQQATGAGDTLPTVAEIEEMAPETVLSTLGVVTSKGDINLAASCCRRVRVLCRENELRKSCDMLGAARILIQTYDAMPSDPTLVLQSLAALVNLCSGDAPPPRTTAVEAGAIRAAAGAIKDLGSSIEIGEMACLVVQNLCYGDDNKSLDRRQRAADDGAIESVLWVLNAHPDIKDTCTSSCRLCVDRMPKLRERAVAAGAPPEAVKPITKEGGGLPSFRGLGMGTSRLFTSKSKVKEQAVGAES